MHTEDAHPATEAHLAECQECRTLAEFVQTRNAALQEQLPSAAASRAELRARLEKAAAEPRPGDWLRFAFAAAGLAVAMLAAYHWRAPVRNVIDITAGVAPIQHLTPGATVPVSVNEICTLEFTRSLPAIPDSIQREVFAAYGISNPKLDAYEVDYLITPQLGGATNARNLWPEPYYTPTWNARVKDELEDRLHEMVCRGELELSVAQRDIAADWISAYKKYLGRDKPGAVLVEPHEIVHAGF